MYLVPSRQDGRAPRVSLRRSELRFALNEEKGSDKSRAAAKVEGWGFPAPPKRQARSALPLRSLTRSMWSFTPSKQALGCAENAPPLDHFPQRPQHRLRRLLLHQCA
jgi:hypothetical protein